MGIRCADHATPLYPQKLALTSPTGGGRSVGIVRSRTEATEFSLVLDLPRKTGNLHEDQYTFLITSHSVFLRTRNVTDNICRENHNTRFSFSKFFFLSSENRAVHEIMWTNTAEPGRQQMTIWRMLLACRIPKVTNTPSEYAILIYFPLQQWL